MSSNLRRPPVNVGDHVTVEPEKLVAGGESISRIDGFPVFVPGLYPGDRADVRIVELKKGFARGELVMLVEPSLLRRHSPCPVARECGGCDWTELRLDAQLRAKRQILIESLTRIGRMDPAAIPEVRIHASPLNYRLRSRLQVGDDGRLGFFAPTSHRVVPLPASCEVVGPATALNASRMRCEPAAGSVLFFEGERQLHVANGSDSEEASAFALLDIDGRIWRAAVGGFFQVNRHLLATMQTAVGSIAAATPLRNRAYDLYGGAGFFAWPLSKLFGEVVSVESSSAGHAAAVQNMRDLPNVRTVQQPVETFLTRAPEADLIFLDPPRAGAAAGVIERVATLARQQVCYLSCDPVTFARDVSRLLRRGWALREIHILDLFPNTHHLETLAAFRRD